MLIDDVIEFCDLEYQNEDCIQCNSKIMCDGDCNGCKQCLDDIHYHYNKYRDFYDCEKLLDYYVCRYSYKYCSEMIYALNELDLSEYPYFHILSLGCGAAPDLMAFEYMGYKQKISYCGLDKNTCLEKIHNFIKDNYWGGKVRFYRDIDVLTYFENHALEKCNVLIVQYLISFFYNDTGVIGLKQWFKQLANNIVKYKPKDSPMLIIINDADSINTGRDAFPLFVNEIEKVGLNISVEVRKRFKNHNYYENSEQYETKRNIFDIAENFISSYCVAITCESAQLILEVN
ncbi:MAG: hypothetical protein HFJ84_09305 [Clostridiales bacterium]|jgi:hypothetical protein|nr:hypothetical protein [Clostridiales bacterium]